MRKFSLFIIISLFLGFAKPWAVKAETADFYADAVYSASNQVYQPANALGMPDSVYSDFFDKDAVITLDMGEGEEGTGDLTLSFRLLNYGAAYRVEFMNEEFIKVQTTGASLPLSVTETTITFTGGVPYRYVAITSIEEETWSLDAVTTASVLETEETETTETAEEVQEEEVPVPDESVEDEDVEETCGGNRGLNIKRVDDSNPETTADAIIFSIGCDGTLHIFPNEQTYKTWWPDFDDVAFVSGTFLAQHDFGDNVTIRPGTYLIKTVSDPKVYAIEPGGILRWIPDEATAVALYGANWNKIIIDIPDEFFSDYTLGENLTASAYPNGIIGYLPVEGRVVYIKDNSYFGLTGDIINSMRLDTKFLVPLSAEIITAYTDGGDLTYDEATAFPF